MSKKLYLRYWSSHRSCRRNPYDCSWVLLVELLQVTIYNSFNLKNKSWNHITYNYICSIVRVSSYSFYPFDFKFCNLHVWLTGQSLWNSLNQFTFICKGWLLTKRWCIWHHMIIMRCQIRYNFIIKQWYKNKCIDRVYIKMINRRIQDQMDI